MKIKFHLNGNIEQHCMQLELNSSVEKNITRYKLVHNVLKIYLSFPSFMTFGVEEKLVKKQKIKKKQLCIILTMVLDILFEIVKTRPHISKDPFYTSFEILINRMIYVRQPKKWVFGL